MPAAISAAPQPEVAARTRFKLLTVEELKNQPPPEWLLAGTVIAGSFAVVMTPVRPGPVVYVAAEGVGGLRSRVTAWEVDRRARAQNVFVLPEAVNFMNTGDVTAFVAAVEALGIKPVLVVIDTMARCFAGGDENGAKDVGQFVAHLDAVRKKFGCAVLVIHHVTKANDRVERGSGVLRGAADTMMFLHRDAGRLVLGCEKQKDAAPFQEKYLESKVVPLRGEDSSCVMRSVGAGRNRPADPVSEHEQAIQAILSGEAGPLRHGEIKARFASGHYGSKSAFDRAWRTLKRLGLVQAIDGKGYVLATRCQVSEQCQDGVTTPEPVS